MITLRRLIVFNANAIALLRFVFNERGLRLTSALITWYATERGVATLAEVARRLHRDPSTLFVAVERYRTLRPELFNVMALQDSTPLIRPVTLAHASEVS